MTILRFSARLAMAGLLGAAAICAPACAAPGGSDVAGVEWLLPVAPRALPQSKAEKEAGKTHGRALPAPELLQPTLDPAIPAYRARPDLHLSATITVAASDILPGLVRRWIAGFEQIYPDVHIVLSPPFAGSLGATELAGGKLDIAFVSRELRPVDITAFKAKFGYPPLSVPISGGTYRHYGFLDSVGVFVNKANPIARLSFTQLDAILSSTRLRGGKPITTWGQLGLTGEWAKRPIHIYGVKPWNGFEEFVRQRVLSANGKRGEWTAGIHYVDVVFPLAGDVSKDPDGIGYSGLAYIDAPVKMLPLQAKPGGAYFAPTYENVARADYPLSRLVFANVNKDPGKPLNPALQQFLLYILSKEGAQKVLDQAIYLPLRAGQARESRALLGD